MSLVRRFERLVRSWSAPESDRLQYASDTSRSDADLEAAWAEMEAHLRRDEFARTADGERANDRGTKNAGAAGARAGGTSHHRTRVEESLRADYAALEVPFAAPLDEVRRAYRRLAVRYHPDKFVSDAARHATAHEIMIRLADAVQRIERYHAGADSTGG